MAPMIPIEESCPPPSYCSIFETGPTSLKSTIVPSLHLKKTRRTKQGPSTKATPRPLLDANGLPILYLTIPAPAPVNAIVFSLSFRTSNRIRLADCPTSAETIIRQSLDKYWYFSSFKAQGETDRYTVPPTTNCEYWLPKRPWNLGFFQSKKKARGSRRLVVGVMQDLAVEGWTLLQGTEVSQNPRARSVLFFENGFVDPDPDAIIFAVAFSRHNRALIISAPSNIVTVISEALKSVCGIKSTKHFADHYNACEIRLKVKGFRFPRLRRKKIKKSLKSSIFSSVSQELRKNGFKFIGSLNPFQQKQRPTWFFRKVTRAFQ